MAAAAQKARIEINNEECRIRLFLYKQ